MRVLVTGATGFLGRHVVQHLQEKNIHVEIAGKTNVDAQYSLDLTYSSDTFLLRDILDIWDIDTVIHCAGLQGGIQFNLKNKYRIFYENSMMALNTLNAIKHSNVKRVVSILPSCSYPGDIVGVLKPEDYWNGLPNYSVKYHGIAKRNLQMMSEALTEDSDILATCVCLTNLYGPHDNFSVENSKVVSGMIRKFVDARENDDPDVTLWGTGKPLRDFLFVEDAARGIVESIESHTDHTKPSNIGSGKDVSIKELAELIKEETGYCGDIVWDTTKTDGQYRKLLELRNFQPQITLRDGLQKTVRWFEENRHSL